MGQIAIACSQSRFISFRLLIALSAAIWSCKSTKPTPQTHWDPAPTTVKPAPSPLARTVNVGGKNMYLECVGNGSPTVVFDSGHAAGSRVWESVFVDMSKQTRACRYDRLGMDLSDPAPRPHTPIDMALELGELLVAAAQPPPYVLVGHSLGGINIRLYTREFPQNVVGLVLVDASHEEQHLRVDALVPEEIRERLHSQFDTSPEGMDFNAFTTGLDSLRHGERSLASRPLIVLSGSRRPRALPGVSADTLERMWLVRQTLQGELVQHSSNSLKIVAKQSGHFISRDQPQLVINAIAEVLRAARTNSPLERSRVIDSAP